MRTMFLALFLSVTFGMSSAYAQEAPKTNDTDILGRMTYTPRPFNAASLIDSWHGEEFGTVKVLKIGGLNLIPKYSFTYRAEAWMAPEAGQEIRIDELMLQAYARKHPKLTFQMTGTFAQHDHPSLAAPLLRSARDQSDPAREKKLSIGSIYRF